MRNQNPRSWFFHLCALEGAVASTALLLIPSEGGDLSTARLALLAVLLATSILFEYLALRDSTAPHRWARPRFILLSALLALAPGASLFLLRYADPGRLYSAYVRLSPLLWYFLVVSVQLFFLLLYLYKGLHPASLTANRGLYTASGVFMVLLLLMFILVAVTGLGVTPDPAYWGEPGVPIAGWQFVLAVILGLGVFCWALRANSRLTELALPAGIYLFAIVLWLSIPFAVQANSFYMPIGPPAFQPFPYSDAAYYDQMAHSLLVGHPYLGEIPTRPLYIFFLTILHLLFGENYRAIISAQTVVLAAIPVALYLLGKKLHSQSAGVMVGLFFIFREAATLLVSSNTRVSSTKTLLVDLPTLLLLLLACLFALRWFERGGQKDAMIAGGMFGLLLLLRTQSMLLLPLILLMSLLVFGWKGRRSYSLAAIFMLGLLITVLPWLTHNYLQSGAWTFDAPFQYKVIASQYAYSGNLDIQNYDFEGKGLGRVLLDFVLKDPGFVFGFITNHFLAAQIGGLLALPLIKPYNGIFEPVNLYWMDWTGSLEWYNIALLVLYLAVIALGLGAAWRRWRWIGLLPLAFSFGYALATSIGRFSGWRYDLPADWIWYFYFGIGAAEVLRQAARLFGVQAKDVVVLQPPVAIRSLTLWNGVSIGLIFALISASPWLIKSLEGPRYPDQGPAALEERISSIAEAPSAGSLSAFVAEPGAYIRAGRLLYPRSFSRNTGIASTNPWPAYAIRDYPRLGFLLLNQTTVSAIFPGRTDSLSIPHAADVIVVGCQREDFIEVRLIAFPGLDSIHMSAPLDQTCSP